MSEAVTHKYETTGMHCHSCSMLVQMSVSDIDGVDSVDVDLAKGLTTVTFEPEKTGDAAIVAEIVKAGYGASLIEE